MVSTFTCDILNQLCRPRYKTQTGNEFTPCSTKSGYSEISIDKFKMQMTHDHDMRCSDPGLQHSFSVIFQIDIYLCVVFKLKKNFCNYLAYTISFKYHKQTN